MTTRFVVLNSDGSTAYDSAAQTRSQSVQNRRQVGHSPLPLVPRGHPGLASH